MTLFDIIWFPDTDTTTCLPQFAFVQLCRYVFPRFCAVSSFISRPTWVREMMMRRLRKLMVMRKKPKGKGKGRGKGKGKGKGRGKGKAKKAASPKKPSKANPKRMDLVRRVQVRSQLRNPRERPRKKVWERM